MINDIRYSADGLESAIDRIYVSVRGPLNGNICNLKFVHPAVVGPISHALARYC